MNKLTISYDIGHSSIGWAILESQPFTKQSPTPEPSILGCGSVTFPKDDCLASSRRDHRRSRRNIRATRLRIERLKKLILHIGSLTSDELDATGHSSPHALAAKSLLTDQPTLTWLELWNVLRWYAHNRGYDGNSRWSKIEDDSDDTEKEKAALNLMQEHATETMAETICAVLGIDPFSKKISSHIPYKTLDAAFPRHIVRNEVLEILEKHKNKLPHLDDNFIHTLIASDDLKDKKAWETIKVPSIKLPRRYFGGLLFGQLIPRFDNRIISSCPISGDKVPNKSNMTFLRFRWAMLIANIKADGKFLTSEQRLSVNDLMENKGRLTPTELGKHVTKITNAKTTNIKASFEIHPDSKDALELDPAKGYAESATSNKRNSLYPFWKHLNDSIRNRATNRWKKQRPVSLQWMLDQCALENHDNSELKAQIQQYFEADQKKKKPSFLTEAHLLRKNFAPKELIGRARYSRKVMQDVYEFVLSSDRHPTEASKWGLPAGPIYRSKEVKATERDKSLPELTNNHLIRQRLQILLKLTDDIIKNYANNDPSTVTDVIVEVARDLQEYSGLTAKEMQGELTKRLSHFKSAVKYLEENAPDLIINGSLIRKCRIAMDLDWHCPFTGKRYDAMDLKSLEREHIIPYADRPTNALNALVLTFDWVNKLKGKRTGAQFIKDMSDDERFFTPKQYEKFVTGLKTANKNSYPDDYRRQMSRKKLMLVENYEAKDHGFTAGTLTQTSHLNRLSARQLESKFIDPATGEPSVQIHSIPGQVTAETRKSWNLLGTLAQACPEILESSIAQLKQDATTKAEKELKKQIKSGTLTEQDRAGLIQTFIDDIPEEAKKIAGEPKNKTSIRDITHLHHALDAATLAITHHYLPGILPYQKENEKGAIWEAMLKRNKTETQAKLLTRTGLFISYPKKNKEGKPAKDKNGNQLYGSKLNDIPVELKNNLAEKLTEKRVIQHIPADQSGSDLEETTWRYVGLHNGQAVLTQLVARTGLKENLSSNTFAWQDLEFKKEAAKLLPEIQSLLTAKQINLIKRGRLKLTTEPIRSVIGLEEGKLSENKSVRVISTNYGIALGKEPQLIPFHSVPKHLAEIKKTNNGTMPPIIKNGSIISVESGTWKGIWRVTSVKESIAYGLSVDLAHPEKLEKAKGNAKVPNMIESGLKLIHPPFTGINKPK